MRISSPSAAANRPPDATTGPCNCWKTERFCIAAADRPRFVAAMEEVLDTYQATYDDKHPLIGMDEAARQLLSDAFDPLPLKPGRAKRVDDKYDRHGTCSLFMFCNPVGGGRRVGCRDSRTACDWAEEVRHLLEVDYPDAEWVTLVCDNLNTHNVASLYKAFDAETAGRLRRRLRLVMTVNGSWLNVVVGVGEKEDGGQTFFGDADAALTGHRSRSWRWTVVRTILCFGVRSDILVSSWVTVGATASSAPNIDC